MTKSGFEPLTHGVWIRCSNQLSYFANIISYMSAFKRRHTTVTFSAFQKGIQHRWLRGLRRYLIGFAPHAFAPQCQIWARKVLSLSVFLLISKNLTSPLEIPLSPLSLQCNRSFRFTYYINKDLTKSYETQPTRHLRPIIPNNTCPFCITAAAGTDISRGFFCKTRHYPYTCKHVLAERVLQAIYPSSLTRYSRITLSCIVHDSSLLSPMGAWAVSQSQCGWSSAKIN